MSLASELRTLLGSDRLLEEPIQRYIYGTDSSVVRGEAELVALPVTAPEVSACVKLAAKHGTPIVARGAGTGLAGGAVPLEPALVISLTKMNTIEVDEENRTAWVGPGVINLDLSKHVDHLGVHFAPDPSSQSICTIGGNVANNSGGPHCLADGTTVDHILALEIVTADGEVIEVGGPAPDPVGLDLRGILVGSEGTLGIVTRVLVKLTPNPPDVRTILGVFDSVEDAAGTVSGIIARGLVPAALEMMDQRMIRAVENFVHAGLPVDAAAVLLAEVAGHPSAVEAEAAIVEEVARANHATEVQVAQSAEERAVLWKARKSAFGAVAQAAPDYYLHDAVVPRTQLVDVMTKTYEIADRYEITMMNVFHAGDGNLHPLMAFDAAEPGMLDKVHAAGKEIVEVCVSAGGVLSGEHGVGMEKRDLMPLMFGEADLDGQARLREAFDPHGIFNPGKVLPEGSRCFDLGARPPSEDVWV